MLSQKWELSFSLFLLLSLEFEEKESRLSGPAIRTARRLCEKVDHDVPFLATVSLPITLLSNGGLGRTVKNPYKNTFIVFACFYQHKLILDGKIWVQIQPFTSQPWTFECSVYCNWVWGNTNDNRPTHSNYFLTLLVTRGLKKECALENFHLK